MNMKNDNLLTAISVEGSLYLLMTLLISIWFPLWGVLLVSGIGLIDTSLSFGYYGWLHMKKPCPSCKSGIEVGKDSCILCSNPKTGVTRGWVWRWNWLHYRLVSRHNFKKNEKYWNRF